jgi:hypothetical protein
MKETIIIGATTVPLFKEADPVMKLTTLREEPKFEVGLTRSSATLVQVLVREIQCLTGKQRSVAFVTLALALAKVAQRVGQKAVASGDTPKRKAPASQAKQVVRGPKRG